MKVFVAWMHDVQLSYAYMSCPVISSCETFLDFDVYRVALRQLMVALFLKNWNFWLIFDKVVFLCFDSIE